MQSPPLRLESLFYDRVMVNARRDYDPSTDEDGEVETTVRFAQRKDDDRVWRIDLQVTITAGADGIPPKYEADVHAVGVVRVHPELPEEEMPNLVAITGSSLLYTSLREFLMTVTARGPWGSFMLPTASFRDLRMMPNDRLEAQAALIREILLEKGPSSLSALSKSLGIPREELSPLAAELARQGLVEKIRKGRTTQYQLKSAAGRVAESST
jgi:preprotein translocase subunit SecB